MLPFLYRPKVSGDKFELHAKLRKVKHSKKYPNFKLKDRIKLPRTNEVQDKKNEKPLQYFQQLSYPTTCAY